MRYRSRPIVIDAIQWTGTNTAEVRAWVFSLDRDQDVRTVVDGGPNTAEHLFITRSMTASTGNQAWRYVADGQDWGSDVEAAVYDYLHDTWVGVKRGQWVIRGTKGELYPCDPEVFAEKYEPAGD